MDASRDAERLGVSLEVGGPELLIGAGHDEIERGIERGGASKGVDEEVAAFFPVDAAEKEEEAATSKFRAVGVEGFELIGGVGERAAGAVGNDEAFPAMQPEALLRETLFGLGGEEDAIGAAENPVLGGEPIEPLFLCA